MTDIARERRLLAAAGLELIPRETWGARQDYESDRTVEEPARWFFLHISVTNDSGDLTGNEHVDMRTIAEISTPRGGAGIRGVLPGESFKALAALRLPVDVLGYFACGRIIRARTAVLILLFRIQG